MAVKVGKAQESLEFFDGGRWWPVPDGDITEEMDRGGMELTFL